MKVTPLGDRILVKMVEMETKTAGGILIPQTAQEKTQEGFQEEPLTQMRTIHAGPSRSIE